MVRTLGAGSLAQAPVQQADATISQANPVSTTLYPVLAATKNCRLISAMVNVTWATTQPTPLEIVVTIDGRTITFAFVNPVTNTNYIATIAGDLAETAQPLVITSATDPSRYRPFILEGRTVAVACRVTWATTQPTPLICRVKYAKWI